jgi:hypothetical protein
MQRLSLGHKKRLMLRLRLSLGQKKRLMLQLSLWH